MCDHTHRYIVTPVPLTYTSTSVGCTLWIKVATATLEYKLLLIVDVVVVVVVVDSHIQRIVLATEETTVTQQVSHRPIKRQSRLWSQRGTKVNGSHYGDNPLLRPTGIQIATKSYAALQAGTDQYQNGSSNLLLWRPLRGRVLSTILFSSIVESRLFNSFVGKIIPVQACDSRAQGYTKSIAPVPPECHCTRGLTSGGPCVADLSTFFVDRRVVCLIRSWANHSVVTGFPLLAIVSFPYRLLRTAVLFQAPTEKTYAQPHLAHL